MKIEIKDKSIVKEIKYCCSLFKKYYPKYFKNDIVFTDDYSYCGYNLGMIQYPKSNVNSSNLFYIHINLIAIALDGSTVRETIIHELAHYINFKIKIDKDIIIYIKDERFNHYKENQKHYWIDSHGGKWRSIYKRMLTKSL